MKRKNYTISIKRKLILTLSIVVISSLTITYIISFYNAKNEIRKVFDAHLIKSSKLIFGLIRHEIDKKENINFFVDFNFAIQKKSFDSNENKIHFQAWQNDKMIYSSDEKISPEPDYEGFRDIIINDTKWRSFSFYDTESGIRILVSERNIMRDNLIFEILMSLFIPLILCLFPILLIIATIINRNLNPLQKLAFRMKKMSTNTLQHFDNKKAPLEFKPFIDSFNELITRLKNSLESEQRFTDYAAHELKTPLTIIKIQAQLLAKNHDKNKNEDYLRDLLNGVDRATHLINQLLTLTRIEPNSEEKIIDKTPLNLIALIKLIAQDFCKEIDEKNLKIEYLITPQNTELTVLANKMYLEIMIRNIIDNAVKYSYKDSKILVTAQNENHYLALSFSNKGDKISQDNISKIFNNFFRINKAKQNLDNPSCGLGLAIVKKISNLHKWRTSFSSNAELNSITIKIPSTSILNTFKLTDN